VSSRIVGIDLGTSNSCVAVVEGGKARALGDEGRRTIPSCLGFARGKEVVGEAARRLATTDPHNTVVAAKRILGHSYDSPEVQKARERMPYAIRPSPLGSVLLEVGGRELTPVQVSARVLQKVKQVAEQALGESVEKAVISVPAHFNDVQRKATKLAAEYAGLEVVRLINEPTAAAFAYGYRRAEDLTLAVYDLGGGTFDITVMTAKGDTFQVDATDGDSYLGGEDFDHAIVDWLISEFQAEHGHDLRGDEAARLRVKEAAERAKRELSEVPETQIELPFLAQLPDGSRPHFARKLGRDKLEELVRPLVDRSLELCKRCLLNASLQREDVSEVLLVGGMTRMPFVRNAVKQFFGKEPRRDINPDEAVALGAALFAYSISSGELREEALEAAEEAYEVAYRQTAVARRVLADVERLRPGELASKQGGDRLQDLLEQAELEIESQASLPELRAADLPAAVEKLKDELLEIERRAAEVMRKAQLDAETSDDTLGSDGTPLPFDREALFETARERIAERVALAQDASEKAESRLEEAEAHGRARKVELIDVTSHALGIAAAADVMSVLVPKNTKIPARHVRNFTTHQDGQTEVEIRVFQGPYSRASENHGLGSFVLEHIPPAARMQPKIEVAFELDASGMLAVSASDKLTGRQQSMRIEAPVALRQEESAESVVPERDEQFG
jgi:molecular chaperone DnaK (HSP70)